MPKLLDRARNALSGPPLTPADIEARLQEARATLASLSADHQRAALDAEAGFPGAAEELAAIVASRQAASERVATLDSALVAAHDQDGLSRQKTRAKLTRDHLARIAAHLEKRDRAAERLSTALAAAADAWTDLVEQSSQAAIPAPDMPYPSGSLTSLPELRRVVEREMYRVGAARTQHARDFPGGRPHDYVLRDHPAAIPALVDVVRGASAHVNATLAGHVLEPAQ